MEDFRTMDTAPDQLPRLDVLDAAPSSYSNDNSMVLEDDTRLFSDCNSSTRGLFFTCDKLPLSLGSYDKPRRVLRSQDSAYVVTAHGVIDQVCAAGGLRLDRHIRIPQLPLEEAIDDACILSHHGDSIIILGHARERNQLTVLNLARSHVSISVWQFLHVFDDRFLGSPTHRTSPWLEYGKKTRCECRDHVDVSSEIRDWGS